MEKSDHALVAWGQLCRAHAAVARRLECALNRDHGLSLTTYVVLRTLADAPDSRLRLSDIVRCSDMTKSGVSRLIDRLESSGHVTTEGCPSDRRGAFAVLTPAGLNVIRGASETFSSRVRDALEPTLGGGDVAILGDLLQRIS